MAATRPVIRLSDSVLVSVGGLAEGLIVLYVVETISRYFIDLRLNLVTRGVPAVYNFAMQFLQQWRSGRSGALRMRGAGRKQAGEWNTEFNKNRKSGRGSPAAGFLYEKEERTCKTIIKKERKKEKNPCI